MSNFFAVLILAAIGSLFGKIGFWIGLGIGIFGWIGSTSKKDKTHPKAAMASKQDFAPNQAPQGPQKPNPAQAQEYAVSAAELFSRILCFYPSSDSSKVNDITRLLKGDDWITDKFGTLDLLATRLPHMQSERRDSPIIFHLHSNALVERVLQLPKPMKSRLAMQLDSLSSGFGSDDPKDCKDLIDKFLLALRKDAPASSERLEAEDLIMRSGDPQAISTLQEMRRNPSRYRDMLRSGANGNTVLKTAFGVFAGLLAAEAVKAAVTDHQMKGLLSNLDQDIEKAGGLDSVPLADKELETFATAETDAAAFSGINEDVDANTRESEAGLSHVSSSESSAEDAPDLSSDADDVHDQDIDVSDVGSDFEFDLFD